MKVNVNKKKLYDSCRKYGINPENAMYYTNVVVVPSHKNGLYVVFDKNCRTLNVLTTDVKGNYLYQYIEGNFLTYDKYRDGAYCLDDPFSELSYKHIINISNNDEIHCSNQKHSTSILNSEPFGFGTEEQDMKKMLSYIKFLGEEIEIYFQLRYHILSLGYSEFTPEVFAYLNSIIQEIDSYVTMCIKDARRPYPVEFIERIGQGFLNAINKDLLYDIFDLVLRSKGYKAKAGCINGIQEIDFETEGVILKALCEKTLNKFGYLSDDSKLNNPVYFKDQKQ